MQYSDTDDRLDTPKKILKVNHAGEFGAINIYKSQIMIGRMFNRDYVPVLEQFLEDEKRHLQIFWREIQRRDGVRCKSYWLCGLGGWFLGAVSALFGRRGVMACTLAVESVVTEHLKSQLRYLRSKEDKEAYAAVESILCDEQNHRDFGAREDGTSVLYAPLRFAISAFTEATIRFGMR
jgi:ubiquinone biosynthesis monooxygenase Coq7